MPVSPPIWTDKWFNLVIDGPADRFGPELLFERCGIKRERAALTEVTTESSQGRGTEEGEAEVKLSETSRHFRLMF